MHPRQSLFPSIPRGLTSTLADSPIQINGMDVEFDEKVSVFPVQVEVVKHGAKYRTRARRPGKASRHERNGHSE